MQEIFFLLQNDHIQIALSIIVAIGWLTVVSLIVFLILHTFYTLGALTKFYKKQPIHGWNKRFYPACLGVIALVILVIWLVGLL